MSWIRGLLREVKPVHAGFLAGSAGVISSKKLSIYDNEEDEEKPRKIEVATSTIATNPVMPYITALRKAIWSALDAVEEKVGEVTDHAAKTRKFITGIPDIVPPEEKMYSGIVVMGISGLAGSFLFARHPFLRKFLAIPALTIGAGAVCYPKTSEKVATVTYNRVKNFDYQKYFTPSPEVKKELKELQVKVADVEAKVASELKSDIKFAQAKAAVVEAKVAEVEAKVAAELKSDVKALQATIAKVEAKVATEIKEDAKAVQAKLAEMEAKVAAEIKEDAKVVQAKLEDAEAKVAAGVAAITAATVESLSPAAAAVKKEVKISVSQDAATAETVGSDLGQARPEDLETYTTRR